MDINDFTQRIAQIDWGKYDHPEYFKYSSSYDGITSFAQSVPKALLNLALTNIDDRKQGGDKAHLYKAHNAVEALKQAILSQDGNNNSYIPAQSSWSEILHAIANNHSGNYYSVTVAAIIFIIEVALHGNTPAAKGVAFSILDELYFFYPYVPNISIEDTDTMHDTVCTSIRNAILENKESILAFADNSEIDQFHIMNLLEILSYAHRDSLEKNLKAKKTTFMPVDESSFNIRANWLETFAQHVDFNKGKRPQLTGEEATQAFLAQEKSICHIFFQHYSDAYYNISNASAITLDDLLDNIDPESRDLYVVDEHFTWTYALDHEHYGPFFHHINLTNQ